MFLSYALRKSTLWPKRFDEKRPPGRARDDPGRVSVVLEPPFEARQHPGQDSNSDTSSNARFQPADRGLRQAGPRGKCSLAQSALGSEDSKDIPELAERILAEGIEALDDVAHRVMVGDSGCGPLTSTWWPPGSGLLSMPSAKRLSPRD